MNTHDIFFDKKAVSTLSCFSKDSKITSISLENVIKKVIFSYHRQTRPPKPVFTCNHHGGN